MTSVLLEFSMFPTSDDCRDGASVSREVSKIIDIRKNSSNRLESKLNRSLKQ